jgi:N-methylhydantoinase A
MLQMIEIGAGGGSMAGINHLGLLQVGPESAGANPGPACYGLGGHEPTVTDADLVLGYLDPGYFLGGRMRLDSKRAADAVMQHVGRVGDLSLDRAAWGIHDLVNENMAGAARVHIVENAFDPRDFTLVAFGGAGPVHACGVAEKLGIRRMIVPPLAGVLSSLGLLAAAPGVELARSYPISLGDVGWDNVDALFAEMREYGLRLLAEAGVSVDAVTFRRRVDMRYAGQGFEIGVDMGVDVADWKALGGAFDNTYRTLFGRTIRDVDVEAVTWRLGLAGPVRRLGLPRWNRSGPIRKGERAIFVPGRGHTSVPVYDRYALRPGDQVAGPAVVEEAESTVVAWARSRLTVDERLNLIVDLGDIA